MEREREQEEREQEEQEEQEEGREEREPKDQRPPPLDWVESPVASHERSSSPAQALSLLLLPRAVV